MGKKIPVVTVAEPAEAARLAGLPLEATIAMADVASAIKDGLLAFASATGLMVMSKMMEAELAERIGPKHARIPGRQGNWHGTTAGSVVLGGRKVTTERPRGRSTDGGEVSLDTWAVFSNEDLLTQVVVERMLAGVPTRRHVDVAEPLGPELDARSTAISRSAVSRAVQAGHREGTGQADGSGPLRSGRLCCDDRRHRGGRIVPGGGPSHHHRRQEGPCGSVPGGHREQDRGHRPVGRSGGPRPSGRNGLLVVIDGAKALAAGVRKVFGDQALVQRCTLHKRRNVSGYLPKEIAGRIDHRLAACFNHPDPDKGLARARTIAAELEKDHPDAAASLREGLEDMFTVRRLGVSGRLAKTLTNTNCIESMISVARTVMGNVKRWKDGPMKKRWVAAGMLESERSFRRVKGCKEMPVLVDALRRNSKSVRGSAYDEEAA